MDQQAEVERLQRELGELSAARDSLAVEQSPSESQRQELESQLAQRESRLGELSGELESARSERAQAEQSAMDQRAEVERLQRELGELSAARDTGSAAVSERVAASGAGEPVGRA